MTTDAINVPHTPNVSQLSGPLVDTLSDNETARLPHLLGWAKSDVCPSLRGSQACVYRQRHFDYRSAERLKRRHLPPPPPPPSHQTLGVWIPHSLLTEQETSWAVVSTIVLKLTGVCVGVFFCLHRDTFNLFLFCLEKQKVT